MGYAVGYKSPKDALK